MITYDDLKIDCSKCFGLCCIALNFSKSDGFPKDKRIGEPCHYLREDFKCSIHEVSEYEKMRGCIRYDCFGAGQRVSSEVYKGVSWKENKKLSKEMFDVFLVVQQLNEILWYLLDTLRLTENLRLRKKAEKEIDEILAIYNRKPEELIKIDIEQRWECLKSIVLDLGKEFSEKFEVKKSKKLNAKSKILGRPDLMGTDLRKYELRGENFSGAFLISSDMSECDLSGVNFLGADIRDANLKGANLKNAIYLTQRQINAANGDSRTMIPSNLSKPFSWGK